MAKIKAKVSKPLTEAQNKALDASIYHRIAEDMREHNINLCATILYAYSQIEGAGKKRCERFWEKLNPLLNDLLKRYDLNQSDETWICTTKMERIGVDVKGLTDRFPFWDYTIKR